MKKIAVVACVLLGLLGCSNSQVSHYAETSDWSGLAQYDVEVGHHERSETDLSQLGAIDSAQQKVYREAYAAHVETYCDPKNAFRLGLLGKPKNYVCIDGSPEGRTFEKNWETGREGNSL